MPSQRKIARDLSRSALYHAHKLLEDEQHSHVTTQHALAIESARIVDMASQHQVALLARTRQLARKQLSLNRLQSRLEGCEFSLAQHVTSHLRDVASVKLAERARADAELLTAQLEAAQHIYARSTPKLSLLSSHDSMH